MILALRDAGVDAADEDYLNAHATGTPLRDLAEALAPALSIPGNWEGST